MNPRPDNRVPAAIYLRRSTDRQEKSLGDQRKEILRYAAEHGFEVVAEFVDDGVSGTSGENRQGFLSMLNAARSDGCRWCCILVWDVKRFGRMSGDEVGYYRYLFTQAGIKIIYTSEGFTGTAADRYLRFFKQEAARDESATLSKAVIRGLVSLADQGWWPGGMAPYGYDLGYFDQTGALFQIVRNTDDGQKLILDPAGNPVRTVSRGQKVKGSDREHVRLLPSTPDRVDVIRRIFGWYTGGAGLGFKSIADRLNREGVVSPKAKGWAMSSIRVIIMNPAYIGRVTWNRRRMGKFHRISDRREVERDGCGKRRTKWNDPQDWLVFENAHEALVDPDTFDRAQRIQETRGNHRKATGFLTGKAKTSSYLLSGLVSCGACGGSMHGRTTWRNKWRKDGTRIGTAYYVCGAAITKGKTVCQPIQFLQHKLDDFVLDFVAQRIDALLGARGRDTLRALIERQLAPAGPDPAPERRRLKAREKELTTKIDSVIDLMATASADHRELMEDRLGRLLAERKEIEGRLRQLDRVRAKGPAPDELVDAILEGLTDARRLFEHGTTEERKRVVRAFVENLTVDGIGGTGELRTKRIPDALSIRDSFKVVAGTGFEPVTFGL